MSGGPNRGIGDNSPRGRGKGRGGSKLRPDAPLSDLLFHERPLLRPIIFVPSVHTKTLFQEEEEILQAVVEEVGEEEQSHVPTADRVFRVFSGANIPRMHSEDEGDEDELEEIDFNDMAKLMETPARPQKTKVEAVEEKFLGILPGTKPTPAEVMDVDPVIAANADQVLQAPSVDIVIDDNDIPPSQLPKELDSFEDSSILIANDAHDITSESQPELLAQEESDSIIVMILEENEDILYGKDRKARNRLFRAVRNGAFEDLDDFKPARKPVPSLIHPLFLTAKPGKNKDKYKDLPPDLQEQWKKDRDKKAEHKRLRALKRLELAADPMSFNRGGKKGRKAMLAAAKLDPTITVLPNRVIDMTTLVQQIRRFVGDIDGPLTMSLPPTTKETRKNIHEMALAFNLKSVSKGKGDARYTSLTKTTRTGLFVDEKKVAKIVRRSGGGGGGGGGGEFMGSNTRGSRGGGQVVPRHREGEEVGKAAPKIGESNIGFKMLALMGWSEGQRIGMTGGLEAPLTAVIKNTKLGLGATR
ncbi:hypothetical protein C0991_007325 [Blastosporella zonata]|nr:hypothetical protein C0991_007325 [Blastosporella zonata]